MFFPFSRKKRFLRELSLPAQCKEDLRSSGMLCSLDLYVVTEVAGHKSSPF